MVQSSYKNSIKMKIHLARPGLGSALAMLHWTVLMDIKEQAGAELCQAQVKLGLPKLGLLL